MAGLFGFFTKPTEAAQAAPPVTPMNKDPEKNAICSRVLNESVQELRGTGAKFRDVQIAVGAQADGCSVTPAHVAQASKSTAVAAR